MAYNQGSRMYTVSFSKVAITVVQDLWQIEAELVPLWIHGLWLGQSSDVGDAESEGLEVTMNRITDAVPADETASKGDPDDLAAKANISINETTQLVTGLDIHHTEVWHITAPLIWLPTPEQRPKVIVDDAFTIALITAPDDSILVSGTLYFSE